MTVKKDTITIGPEIVKGKRLVVRNRDGKVTPGVVEPVKDGEPLNGKTIVSLEHIKGEGDVYRVKEEYSSGPAMVNSQQYKDNYDKIFN